MLQRDRPRKEQENKNHTSQITRSLIYKLFLDDISTIYTLLNVLYTLILYNENIVKALKPLYK